MRYLIDSNILYFFVSDVDELTAEVKDILTDYNNRIYVPAKCVEELMYLLQTQKIKAKRWKYARDIIGSIDELGYGIKHTGNEHLLTLAELPVFSDHKDPTDRIIIAQAITEKIPIISSDRKFHDYKRYGLNFVFNKR